MEQKNILTKLFEVQKMKLSFEKTKENPFTKSKYCPLPEVWKTLEPKLTELKLLCVHDCKDWVLTTTIYDMESGESQSTQLHINSTEAQKTGSDITYYKRYNLGCIFNIITDDDTDWNKNNPKNEKKVFDVKRLEAMKKWAEWKEKAEIMQYVLKAKKDSVISKEMWEEIDLYLKTLN